MLKEIIQRYQLNFGTSPLLIKAPGRINLIGEHTDYNEGFVMPAAIDKAMYFALGKNGKKDSVHIHAYNYKETIVFEKDRSDHLPTWAKYYQAILQLFLEKGIAVQGVHLVFGGNIPIGAGLSSSAALCCGFIFGLSELLNLQIPKKEIALLAQQAEQRIGLNCGLMDQYAVLFGKAGQVFQLDCQSLELDYFPLALKDHSLVLIDSKIEHQLATNNAYNERRTSCENVVRLIAAEHHLQINSLRAISKNMLLKCQAKIPPLDFKRAYYVVAENERVLQLANAIRAHQLELVGEILLNGHWGLSKEYEVSLPAIDLLVQLAEAHPRILGARMMGGGFGGCTLNLVSNQDKEATVDRIRQEYVKTTKIDLEVYEINIGNGVELVVE